MVCLLAVRSTGTDHTDTNVWTNIIICRSVNVTVKSVLMSSPSWGTWSHFKINPLNAELNPTCHLLALLGAHHILHVSRIRVNWWRSSQKGQEAMGPGQGTGRMDGPGRGGQGSGLGEGGSEPHREHRELPFGRQNGACCIGKETQLPAT